MYDPDCQIILMKVFPASFLAIEKLFDVKVHFMNDSVGDDGDEKDGGTLGNSYLASLSVHVTDVCLLLAD